MKFWIALEFKLAMKFLIALESKLAYEILDCFGI